MCHLVHSEEDILSRVDTRIVCGMASDLATTDPRLDYCPTVAVSYTLEIQLCFLCESIEAFKKTYTDSHGSLCRGAGDTWLRGRLTAVDPLNLIQTMLAKEAEGHFSVGSTWS